LENQLADRLARAIGSKEPLPDGAFLEIIKAPSIVEEDPITQSTQEKDKEMLAISDTPAAWMTPIVHAIKGEL
jgi:hypothetical protein